MAEVNLSEFRTRATYLGDVNLSHDIPGCWEGVDLESPSLAVLKGWAEQHECGAGE